jgi:hypothetical protein
MALLPNYFSLTFIVYLKKQVSLLMMQSGVLSNPYFIKAYPNPTSGMVNFSYNIGNNGIIKIYNALGALVGEKTIEKVNNNTQIDLQHLPSTIYYYSVEVEGMPLKREKLILTK